MSGCSMLGVKPKSPADRLDYDVDFSGWFGSDAVITDADAVPDDGLTVESWQSEGAVVKVWVSGGEAGKTYKVYVTATDGSRIKEVCFEIRVIGC